MKICLIIYKIHPTEGSENASGYHLAREIIQKYPDTTLISRSNHIETLRQDPAFRTTKLIGVDVPKTVGFFKKKSHGVILYYYLWQYWVGKYVQKMDKASPFDVIHQINFHADWAPHFLKSPQAQVIWGPIAHHPPIPLSWFRFSGLSKKLLEMANRFAKQGFWHLNPWLRKAMQRSDMILFAHDDIPQPYLKYRSQIHIRPYGGSHWPIIQKANEKPSFHLLFVGRLIPLKGPHIAIDAFAQFLQTVSLDSQTKPHLTIIGSGELQDVIQKKADHLNNMYGSVVTLQSWLPRDQLQSHYQQADYFIYPSLEAQGLVVSEALSQGCLPLTLADTGPATLSPIRELTLSPESRHYDDCVTIYAKKLADLYQDRLTNAIKHAVFIEKARQSALDRQWPVIAQKIMMFYDRAA